MPVPGSGRPTVRHDVGKHKTDTAKAAAQAVKSLI